MTYYANKPNYSRPYGHTSFITAIDRACEAAAKARGWAGQEQNPKEAARLYGVAIAEAETAFREIAANDDWRRKCVDIIPWMEIKVACWREWLNQLEAKQ